MKKVALFLLRQFVIWLIAMKKFAVSAFDKYAQPVLIAWFVFLAIVLTVMFFGFLQVTLQK